MRPTNSARLVRRGERGALAQPAAAAPAAPGGRPARCASSCPCRARARCGPRGRGRRGRGQQLREPQARGIEQLHDRQVAHVQRVLRAAAPAARAIWSASSVCGRRFARLGRADVHAPGCCCSTRSRSRKSKKVRTRRQPALHAARARGRAAWRAAAKLRTCWLSSALPVVDAAALAPVARAPRGRARRRLTVCGDSRRSVARCCAEALDPAASARTRGVMLRSGSGCEQRSAISSPMRARNSMLMPGWKRSRSALPSASRPSGARPPAAPAPPSRCLAASAPNRKSRCAVAHLAAARLADGEQCLEAAEVGVVRPARGAGSGSAGSRAGDRRGSSSTAWKASKSSRSPASICARPRRAVGVRSRRRVKRWMRSASASLARATRTNSASFCSSAACFVRAAPRPGARPATPWSRCAGAAAAGARAAAGGARRNPDAAAGTARCDSSSGLSSPQAALLACWSSLCSLRCQMSDLAREGHFGRAGQPERLARTVPVYARAGRPATAPRRRRPSRPDGARRRPRRRRRCRRPASRRRRARRRADGCGAASTICMKPTFTWRGKARMRLQRAARCAPPARASIAATRSTACGLPIETAPISTVLAVDLQRIGRCGRARHRRAASAARNPARPCRR